MREKAYIERHGQVAMLFINRPEVRNCIDDETAAALNRSFSELEADDSVDVVILTGAGNEAFSSGLDLKQLAREGPALIPKVIFRDTGWAGIAQRAFAKPLNAGVHGSA